MNIVLKKLHMENFKIFQNITIDFSMLTKIFAQNYKGKSSICDGFSWVLFSKSSTGNSEGKQFHPRRYDKDGNDIDRVDIIVELLLDVDGREIAVKKVQHQKWVRKRGAEVETYEGDENTYFWNEVQVKESEHKRRVAEIIDEEIFKLITNPHAFVGKKQDEQRKFLIEKVAQITDADVFQLDGNLLELEELVKSKTLEEVKAINKKALSGYKLQMETIPVRIDEVSKAIVDMDFAERELQLSALKEQLAEVESKISDTSKSYEEVNRIKSEIAEIKGKMLTIERIEREKLDNARYEIAKQIDLIDRKRLEAEHPYNMALADISSKQNRIKRNTDSLAQSKKDYLAVKAEISAIESEQFDENSLNCPTCGQSLPMEEQTALRSKYEVEKLKRIEMAQCKLDGIVDQGNNFDKGIEIDKSDIEELERKIADYNVEKAILQSDLDSKRAELDKLPSKVELNQNQEYLDLWTKFDDLGMKLSDAVKSTESIDTLKAELLQQKNSINDDIQVVQGILASKQHIEDAKDRVIELKEELRQAAQSAAQCEKLDLMIEKFEKTKMKLLSEKVNDKFKVVKWKLFHTQKNGGTENVCVCMIHGSPYGENTTSSTEQLMAGMDIISTLQEIYNVKAPIFIDNKERFNDHNIPNMDCQMVMLSVSEDEEIQVVNE